MCYQIVKRYASSKCIFHDHGVHPCQYADQPGHVVTKKDLYLDLACIRHRVAGLSEILMRVIASQEDNVTKGPLHDLPRKPQFSGRPEIALKELVNFSSAWNGNEGQSLQLALAAYEKSGTYIHKTLDAILASSK